MFNDGGHMGGLHGGWWMFWVLLIGAAPFYVWRRPGRRVDVGGAKLSGKPHAVLRGRLASGVITPQRYDEHKTLLDRDHCQGLRSLAKMDGHGAGVTP